MHISIIDDEKVLVSKVLKKLTSHGYAASAFYGYEDFMRNGDASSQLYIVDLSLGDWSGFDIIKWLRENNRTRVPIIMVSGYGDNENVIYGLELWADDYLIKPVIPEVLVARVKAMFRRPSEYVGETCITYKNITFDKATRETKVDGKEVHLTKNESLILECFLTNQGKMLGRDQLIEQVWGGHRYGDVTDNAINVNLYNLRKKLGGHFMHKTVYNQGYILE